MVLSLLFIVLLRFLAGIMVWVMIVMVILVLGYGASPLPCRPRVCKVPNVCYPGTAFRKASLSLQMFSTV
jgi:hypothetical protein